jgi:hypothetical protein
MFNPFLGGVDSGSESCRPQTGFFLRREFDRESHGSSEPCTREGPGLLREPGPEADSGIIWGWAILELNQ